MSDAPSATTLGQRIDAVLQPLYTEADQHRATLEQAKSQIAALQQQIDTASQGLEQIESRMIEVVRSLASQEPVLSAAMANDDQAAVAAAPPVSAQTPDTPVVPDPDPVAAEPAVQTPAPEPAPAAAPAPEPIAASEPAAAEATDAAEVELGSEEDKAMVAEAASLLEAPVEAAEEPAATPPDIAAAAERAAAAAKQLKDQAATS